MARNDGCPFVVVGGVEDHVHILADIGKKVKPTDMICHIKQESSKFVKTLGANYHRFYWQQGYGMFSVGPTRTEDVKKYIDGQAEHHQHQTFQEEFRAFLDRYGINYDEKYIWE